MALAATLAQGAPLFVADEPTAHLSPAAAQRLHRLLMAGTARTVLIVDHRLDGLIDSVDRVAVIGADGRIFAEGPPATLFRDHHDRLDALGIWLPLASRLDAALGRIGLAAQDPPLSMENMLRGLDRRPEKERARPTIEAFVAGLMKWPLLGDFVRATGVRAVHFGSGVRPRGEVLAPVDELLVAKVRATIDGAASHV